MTKVFINRDLTYSQRTELYHRRQARRQQEPGLRVVVQRPVGAHTDDPQAAPPPTGASALAAVKMSNQAGSGN